MNRQQRKQLERKYILHVAINRHPRQTFTVIRGILFVIRGILFVIRGYCLLYGGYCLLYGGYCLLYGGYCLLYGGYCLLYGGYCFFFHYLELECERETREKIYLEEGFARVCLEIKVEWLACFIYIYCLNAGCTS